MVITQNGKPAAVLITPEEYDKMQEHRRFLTAVQEGLDDVTAGRTFSDDELDAELEAELGWK